MLSKNFSGSNVGLVVTLITYTVNFFYLTKLCDTDTPYVRFAESWRTRHCRIPLPTHQKFRTHTAATEYRRMHWLVVTTIVDAFTHMLASLRKVLFEKSKHMISHHIEWNEPTALLHSSSPPSKSFWEELLPSVKRATYSVALIKTELILEGNLCFFIGSLFLLLSFSTKLWIDQSYLMPQDPQRSDDVQRQKKLFSNCEA